MTSTTPGPSPIPTTIPTTTPSATPRQMRARDAAGREVMLTPDEWRRQVLPGALKAAWSEPLRLYAVVVDAIGNGFAEEVLAAAEHLHAMEPEASRAACMHGIVLMMSGRNDAAEAVYRTQLDRHGDDAAVLGNLAKLMIERNRPMAQIEPTLWRALELDPNQINAVLWYEKLHHDAAGAAAGQRAFERVAALPDGWVAPMCLATLAVAQRDLPTAIARYDEALARAGDDVPAELLAQMSGALGKAGHLGEMLRLVEPRYRPATHGLAVGNNLVMAHIELRQFPDALRIVDAMHLANRPEWNEALTHWDTELAKIRLALAPADADAQADVAVLAFPAPLWLPPASPARELFAMPDTVGISIAFLGSTVERAGAGPGMARQLADMPGRISRALPLFLAEQVAMRTGADCHALVPWFDTAPVGFAVMGAPWSDANALEVSRAFDHVVVTHLVATSSVWRGTARLVRRAGGQALGEATFTFEEERPDQAMLSIAAQIVDLLGKTTAVRSAPPPRTYLPPRQIADYLIRLEQLLAVRCSPPNDGELRFLHGEREIVDGMLRLAREAPKSLPARLLLAETVAGLRRVRPDLADELAARVKAARTWQSLPTAEQDVLRRILLSASASTMARTSTSTPTTAPASRA